MQFYTIGGVKKLPKTQYLSKIAVQKQRFYVVLLCGYFYYTEFFYSAFYTIDIDYVKQLYQIDSEVFYEPTNYNTKPYIGVVIQNGNYPYFIPLTSAKPKHKKWANVSKTNYIIYEMLPANFNPIPKGWIYSESNNGIKHILSVLEIKKMIPVPLKYCTPIDFSQIADLDYRALLQKEYRFLKPLDASIQQRANEIYNKQKQTGKIIPFACDYANLEKVYNENIKTTITV